jgi:hypothetical protein
MASVALRLLLQSHFCSASAKGGTLFPYIYLDDYVRLALCSRQALEPIVRRNCAEMKYIVVCYVEWYEEFMRELYLYNHDSAVHALEHMCLSCDVRQGVPWLGYDECQECYDEH